MLCSYSQGEKDLKFVDVARVIRFKGKAALILQIKDEVYSSSASLQMNRVMLSSDVQSRECVVLGQCWSSDMH